MQIQNLSIDTNGSLRGQRYTLESRLHDQAKPKTRHGWANSCLSCSDFPASVTTTKSTRFHRRLLLSAGENRTEVPARPCACDDHRHLLGDGDMFTREKRCAGRSSPSMSAFRGRADIKTWSCPVCF
jgi:hypothetical protein